MLDGSGTRSVDKILASLRVPKVSHGKLGTGLRAMPSILRPGPEIVG